MRDILCLWNVKYELARGLTARLTSEPLGLFRRGFGGAWGDGKPVSASVWHGVDGYYAGKEEFKQIHL